MAVGQVACVFGAVLCVDRNVLILVYTGWRVWSIFDPLISLAAAERVSAVYI